MKEIPKYNTIEYFEKRHSYCVCIFVLNEGERIASQLRKMQHLSNEVDIIIADGGSNDGIFLDRFLREVNVRTLLVKCGPGKLGAQMRMAFNYALQQGYKGVITIDGNDKDDPRSITEFKKALEEGYDHIQGSRYIEGGKEENTPMIRHYAVKLIHAPLVSISSGFHYTDTTNGFRGYSAKLLKDKRVDLFRDIFTGYELHYYLAIRSVKLGYRVKEIPVTRRYPANGHIPTKINGVKGNINVLLCLLKACFHYYDPTPKYNKETK